MFAYTLYNVQPVCVCMCVLTTVLRHTNMEQLQQCSLDTFHVVFEHWKWTAMG